MRGQLPESSITLSPPKPCDVIDWGCSAQAPTVRVVRQVSPGGALRVLMTNLPPEQVPAEAFADLYHQRWRIEEAFKRLKCRMRLEAVSGLSQHALLIEVAAKVLADNIASLPCNATQPDAELNAKKPSRAHRTHAAAVIQRLLPNMLLCVGNVIALIDDALLLIARMRQHVARGRSAPRPARHVKPHPRLDYKGADA